MSKYNISYGAVTDRHVRTLAGNMSGSAKLRHIQEYLVTHLPVLWCRAYASMPTRRRELVQVTDHGFEYVFDMGLDRVVCAFGFTWYNASPRDSARMGAFLAAQPSTAPQKNVSENEDPPAAISRRQHLAGLSFRERFFVTHGDRYDRGHFMSHRQGGGYDINLFPQLATVNQGKSTEGKVYRGMERECVATSLLCFSRPIYDDESWVPAELEYGVLRCANAWFVRNFPNRPG
jgi:hypothetical protein